MHDQRVCPICKAIDGFQWVFDVRQGASNLTNQGLVHPVYGLVWTPTLGSEAHGKHSNTCRCRLEFDFEFSEMLEAARDFLRALQNMEQEQVEVKP